MQETTNDMEKTRMPKGEKYHFIDDCGFVRTEEDNRELQDDLRYQIGNYFPFGEEENAESAIRNFRAVLDGADVIEMPSEEEWKQISDSLNNGFEDSQSSGIREAYNYLKSKIVK